MAQVRTIDGNILSWVKNEIDTTMAQARQALEASLETPDDESQLRFCLNYLHQVKGTLQMVELYGASMLSEELERLTEALIDKRVTNREDAYEIMIRGMMQLPDYIEKLQSGQPDYPIILLPLLNDLRAARHAGLLTESALFSPNLEVDAPIPLERVEQPIDTLARKLRHAYHLGLLDWFRNNDVKVGLKKLAAVIEKLRKASNDPDASRVLWAAGGVIEALQDRGIDSSVAVKILMGQVDRQVKRIIDQGEFALSNEPPKDLLKNLLYYVASSNSSGMRVNELKQAFQLQTVMPDKETLSRARADLAAPNAALMKTVSTVILDDLAQIKDSLDIFLRSDKRDPVALEPMAESLRQMSDTLGMLGFGDQRHILQDQVTALSEMASAKREVSEALLMEVAGALLGVENALTAPKPTAEAKVHSPSDESLVRNFSDPEQRKLIKRVVDEAKVDLSLIKEAFNEYGRQPKNIQLLKDVPGILDRIRGSLSIMALDRAADILKAAAGYIQRQILSSAVRPEPRTLEHLAESISSVEYYLESLIESWGHPTTILDVAEQSLTELGVDIHAKADEPIIEAQQPSHDADSQTLVDIAMPDGADLQNQTLEMTMPEIEVQVEGEPSDSAAALTEISIEGFDDVQDIRGEGILRHAVTGEEVEEPEVEGSISQEFNLPMFDQKIDSDDASDAEPVAVSSRAEPPKGTLADELDDEIVEIFLEEAHEEHANISRLLPSWFNAPEQESSLKDLRRSFHTLKGSGRLVGAIDVGEFAWAFENMLNRVIDHTIVHSPEMFKLLEQGRNTLPYLLDLFKTGGKPGPEVFTLIAQVEAHTQGKPLSAAQTKPAEPAKDKSPSAKQTSVSSPKVATPPATAVPPTSVKPTPADFMEEGEPTMTQQLDAELPLPLEVDSYDALTTSALMDAASDPDTESIEIEPIELDAIPDAQSSTEIRLETPLPFDITEELLDTTEIIPLPVQGIDPALLDIYRKEIDVHLQSLREFITQWNVSKDRGITQKLIRAMHTIKGSSRTANVADIANLCGVMEDYTRELYENKLPASRELVTLLEEIESYIKHTVKTLDIPGALLPNNATLLSRAQHMLSTLRAQGLSGAVHTDGIEEIEIEIPPEQPTARATTPRSSPRVVSAVEDEEFELEAVPDYDTELLEIFLEEGVDILNDSDHTLHAWIDEPDEMGHVRAMQRQLHTLKGGARMAGVAEIGDLSHSIETMLTAIAEQGLPVNEQMFSVLQKAQDRLIRMLEIVRNNRVPKQANKLIDAINALASGKTLDDSIFIDTTAVSLDSASLPEVAEDPPPTIEIDIPLDETALPVRPSNETTVVEVPADDTGVSSASEPSEAVWPTSEASLPVVDFGLAESSESQELRPTTEQVPVQRQRQELVRVRADLLDNLVNFAGEVSIYRSRMEQQTNTFRFNLKELDDTVDRLRDQLRKFEIEAEAQIQYRHEDTVFKHADFDPLEFDRFTQMQTLSRGMLESLNDLDSLRNILSNLTRESETLLLQQSRVNTELQEGLMRTRLVQIAGQIPRLRRIVRQAADELGKRAELQIYGAENELDRTILERVMSPIEHMLRNAIAHGIETPDSRVAAGKADQGTIQLKFAREASDIVITVSDDGGGINLDLIRKKAVERGRLKPGSTVSKEDLIDLILESGFSTAESVTQIAGRGVGMDVVNSEIKQLGGHLDIETEFGKGTTFRISMPLSLSVARALMVTVSGDTFAIPLIGLETVERVTRDQIIEMQNQKDPVYPWLGNDYRYIHLSSMLGLTDMHAPSEEQRRLPLLLIRSGEYRAAIHVDHLIGSREVVVKPVGPQLSTLRGIAGATIMGDGSVVLILDLGVLIRLSSVEHETAFQVPVEAEAPSVVEVEAVEKLAPLVMVVDDSITVRKVTTRFLERNNFRTLAAKDGVDALTQLLDNKPDVMLLDVEMPRMDGFELATNIRNDANLKDLPIIMITSRTGQKHRDRALSIGVNIYMGKPYSEAELLDNIQKLIAS